MTGHPDADALAEYREGLTGRFRSARIRAHLARCPRCTSLADGLAEVTTLLARAPVPRIPDELAARLDGVLAAESAARARTETPATAGHTPATAGHTPATAGQPPAAAGEPAGTAGGPGPAAEPGSRRGGRQDRPRSARPPRARRVTALRAASATAVLLVIAGGGYGVSRLLQTGGSGSSAASSVNGPASRPTGSSGAHGPAAPGASGAPIVQPGARSGALGVPVVHTSTDYQPGQLAAEAEQVLAAHRAGSAGNTPAFGGSLSSTMAACVQLVTHGAAPSLVDVARYRGHPATVIVRAAAGGRPGMVWVVGPGCSGTSLDLIAHVPLTGSG